MPPPSLDFDEEDSKHGENTARQRAEFGVATEIALLADFRVKMMRQRIIGRPGLGDEGYQKVKDCCNEQSMYARERKI